MSTEKNDFLKFNAYSIKELITRKLSENSKFTDQIYEGSNLAILIDLVSYMYQCLTYQLNNAASESMFSDTQIYKNISRLVNLLGYHPKAYIPSTMDIYFENSGEDMKKTFYPCTAFDTGLTDSRGEKIYFSLSYDDKEEYSRENYMSLTFTNGIWQLYDKVFTANGNDYETFVLDGLKSDSESKQYIAEGGIKMYVWGYGDDEPQTDWNYDSNNLFIESDTQRDSSQEIEMSRIYTSNDKVYSVKLNEDKTFQIKLGNGIIGRKLNKGDKVYVMYLKTNGPDGYIDKLNIDIEKTRYEHSAGTFNMDQELYKKIFVDTDEETFNNNNVGNDDIQDTIRSNGLTTIGQISHPKEEESAEDIKQNAPNWFKFGNRLITKDDYEYYFKANSKGSFGNVIDVKCMNNWEYMTSFYRWIYNMGIRPIDEALKNRKSNPYLYLQKNRLMNSGFEYVDSADANNVYLWLKYSDSKDFSALKSNINKSINNIKTTTTEIYPLNPIDVVFDISFTPIELYYENLVNSGDTALDNNYSYLEITMTDNSIYSNVVITNKIINIIEEFFKPQNCQLGQSINYQTLLSKIYDINGVDRIRTVFYPDVDKVSEDILEKYSSRSCDGISFASWSDTDMINIGDDLQINNSIRQLEVFQFPSFNPTSLNNLKNKIKVIKKSMNTTNPVKF